MAEPALQAYNVKFRGANFSRKRLRHKIGPDNPLFHLLEQECRVELCKVVDDDFTGVLNTDLWTVSNSGSAAAANFARVADTPTGKIRGDAGTTDDGDVRLFTTSNEVVTSSRRPVVLGRIGTNVAVTGLKWEFGFADAVAAGVVLVKDTPTSTGTDYAVVIRDTDDDTSVDMVSDGTADAIQLVASSPGITFATQTWYTVMLALNEQKESYFWIDGVFQGRATRGPDITTTLGIWLYCQNRADADTAELDCDFIKAFCERVPLGGGNAFTT